MELDQLRYFLSIAETGNLSRSAEMMAISQSALSRSIQRLEDEFGQPLIERKARGVALTDAGLLLRGRAEQVLALIDDTKAEMLDDGQSGRLRIGAIPTIAPYLLPAVLKRFSEQYPRATLLVQEDVTERLIKRCKDGELDLAILALPIAARYLEIEPLFEEELFLVLAPEHELVHRKRIQVADLRSYPFVLLDEAHCLSDQVTSFCRRKSFHPVTVEHASQLATVLELVSLDHGISLIPAMARNIDHATTRVYRSLVGPKPTREIAIVWNPYRFQSKLTLALRECLRQLQPDS